MAVNLKQRVRPVAQRAWLLIRRFWKDYWHRVMDGVGIGLISLAFYRLHPIAGLTVAGIGCIVWTYSVTKEG